MEIINLKTQDRVEMIDISQHVQATVRKSRLRSGVCQVFVPHTTAGVMINENADPSVMQDIKRQLSKIIPDDAGYSHSEGNSPAHIKASLVGTQTSVFVESGRLALGTWQGIFFCEFDGPRRRQVWIKVSGK